MLNKKTKRSLSLFLALVMVFSMLPVSTLADETEPTETTETQVVETDPTEASPTKPTGESEAPSEEASEPTVGTDLPEGPQTSEPTGATESTASEPSEEATDPTDQAVSDAATEIQARIDAILTQYGVKKDMNTEKILMAVAEMDWETYMTALYEINELDASSEAAMLTNAEIGKLETSHSAFFIFYDVLNERYHSENTTSLLNGPYDLGNGITVTDSHDMGYGSSSISGGVITVKCKGGSLFSLSSNLKVSYSVTSKSKLSFTYVITSGSASAFTVAGSNAGTSGTYSAEVSSDGSVSITVTCAKKGSATLVLSDFKLETVADSSTVTVNHNGLGSATVAGNTVASGGTAEVTAAGATFAATAGSGATFLGWIDTSDNSILSLNPSFTLTPTKDMTVEPVFINGSSGPHFLVGGAYLEKSLSNAITRVSSAAAKTIILMNSSTLPAGNYTIPSGVTLLIPFDDANTLYTTAPGTTTVASGTQSISVSTYRTLTMASEIGRAHV